MAYKKVIFSSEVKRPMEYQVTPYTVREVPADLGGGRVTTIMYQTTFRTVAIWKMNEQPLCIDIWFTPVLDKESKPAPDRELELDWPMPTERHCDLIAIVIFNADDVGALTEKDIPDHAFSAVFRIV